MSKYTAEQVERIAEFHEQVRLENVERRDKLADKSADMLRAYAALLSERESAKARVTHTMIREAKDAFENSSARDATGWWRSALEAVAPMLASAQVPDEWVRRLSAPITPEELKRAWNMIGQAHPQKEWVERALIGFIELRLAAATGEQP